MENIKFYTKKENLVNAITHGIGAALAVAALVILIVFSSIYGNAWYIVSFTIYGVSLVLLYTISTLYHSLTGYKAKKVFQIMDHSSIYILIAGTYTPILLTVLRSPKGWTIFGIIWGLTILGIAIQPFVINKHDIISTVIYIIMGWLIVTQLGSLITAMPRMSVIFLVLGGVLYTAGACLYLIKKIPYNHGIWHLFVLAGSIFHFFTILFLVV
ncbi:MAG: hemolysin III family protein [Bacillota bacterium]|nr:hemolysin III family protein [Bacillota bacterium]